MFECRPNPLKKLTPLAAMQTYLPREKEERREKRRGG
jgi:hypothetical protein